MPQLLAGILLGRVRHDRTAFVQLDRRRCVACGRCVAVCPREVLGLVALFRHRHAHVDCAAQCGGCLRCVRSCAEGAWQLLASEPEHEP